MDTSEINHCIDETRKVKEKKIGTKDKFVYLRWIANIVASKKKEVLLAMGTSL